MNNYPTESRRMSNYIYLHPEKLKLHPHNMRSYYPDEDVSEMAETILANNGVLLFALRTRQLIPDLISKYDLEVSYNPPTKYISACWDSYGFMFPRIHPAQDTYTIRT